MTPLVKICNTNNCEIVITDLTQDSDEYVPEDTLLSNLEAFYSRNRFRYSDTYTINIIQKNDTEEDIKIVETLFTCHDSYLDEEHYNLNSDGFYTIHHIILPSLEWYNNELEKKDSVLKSNLLIYVTDGSNIYKQNNNKLEIVEPAVISEINTEGTTISRTSVTQFSICHLYDCYLSLCKQIFKGISFKCMNKDNIEDLIFKRDFIWMTINVLKYYVEVDQLWEAQLLLTEINYCGGICNAPNMLQQQNSGCGCSK